MLKAPPYFTFDLQEELIMRLDNPSVGPLRVIVIIGKARLGKTAFNTCL
jgi:hypothetical protein